MRRGIPNLARGLVARVKYPRNVLSGVQSAAFSTGSVDSVQKNYDVCVVGGGIMGCSVAYWLRQLDPTTSVCVVERDPMYTISSSALSVGSLRMQFSLQENIQMSQFGYDFIQNLAKDDSTDVHFDEGGYTFLASPGEGLTILKENVELQRSLGAEIDVFEGDAISQKFPWLNTDGIAMATFGPTREGWFDPYTMMTTFKAKARQEGVDFIAGDVKEFDVDVAGNVSGVRVGSQSPVHISCDKTVLATGCWTKQAMDLVVGKMRDCGGKIDDAAAILPVFPRKRHVYSFHCPREISPDVPLLVDVSGFYVRRDGAPGKGTFIVGGMEGRVEEDPNLQGTEDDLEMNDDYFNNHLWPHLAERIPMFEEIKVTSSWAGFYDYNTFDQNALLGTVPFCNNLLTCTGFSGHGVQQAPAAGLAVAEMALYDEFRTQPQLSLFNASRVAEGRGVFERNIV